MLEIHRRSAFGLFSIGNFRPIGSGDDRLHTFQRFRLRGIDLDDTRMGVGAAQNRAIQHARQAEIRTIRGAARHLIHAVGPGRPFAHPFILTFAGNHCVVHVLTALGKTVDIPLP